MSDRLKATLRLLSFAFAALVLAFVLLRAGPEDVWQSLRGIEAGSAVAVIFLNVPLVSLFTMRSQLILRRLGHRVPIRVLLPASIVGNVAGALTPAGSGELLRAAALQRSGGLTMADALTLVAYERLLSTYLLLLSTAACFALASLSLAWGLTATVACVALGLLPWAMATRFPRLAAPREKAGQTAIAGLIRQALKMAGQVWGLLTDLRLLISWSGLTLLSFAIVALQFHIVAKSLAVHLSLLEAWVAFGGSGLAAIASLIPLGLGVGDGSIAVIIHRTGVPFELATAVTVLIRATVTLPLILLAIASYVYLLRFTNPVGVEADAERSPGAANDPPES